MTPQRQTRLLLQGLAFVAALGAAALPSSDAGWTVGILALAMLLWGVGEMLDSDRKSNA